MKRPSSVLCVLMLLGVSVFAYAPAVGNGYIADDFDNLKYARAFLDDPGFLFTIPPQNFRMTTFLVMGVGDRILPSQPSILYLFSILIHALNAVLLYRLLLRLGAGWREALVAAGFFAVFQAPQEAVMWLSAVAEAMLGTCVLAMLILWIDGRRGASTLVYCLALFTKESAPVAMLLVVVVDWLRGQDIRSFRYAWFVPPTVGFAMIFWWVSTTNPMVQEGLYAFGPHAAGVLLRSMHRLVWPWLYLLVAAHAVVTRKWVGTAVLARALGVLAVAMSPYLFVTYTNALPSRHVYLASIGFAAIIVYLVKGIPSPRFRQAFVAVFLVFNVFYLWTRKDGQFEERAAPTTALLEVLEPREPGPVMIYDFAYPYPSIARSTTQVLPSGWAESMIRLDGVDPPCPECVALRWDPNSREYVVGR
jgi:hypothetical protein